VAKKSADGPKTTKKAAAPTVVKKDDEWAARLLERDRRALEGGDKLVILDAMDFCIQRDIPFPRWLTDAFQLAMQNVKLLHCSWEEVFGRLPIPKGQKRKKQAKTRRRDAELIVPVALKVREYRARKRGSDFANMAADIADKIPGVTESVVKRVYYNRIKKDEKTWEMLFRITEELGRDWRKGGTDPKAVIADLFARHPLNEIFRRQITRLISHKIENS
jgi:hypothetical protein